MFKNYFKIALRNLKAHKSFSVINISGLAIGMACFILIMLWVNYELSYDKFHKNKNEIYRITGKNIVNNNKNSLQSDIRIKNPAMCHRPFCIYKATDFLHFLPSNPDFTELFLLTYIYFL